MIPPWLVVLLGLLFARLAFAEVRRVLLCCSVSAVIDTFLPDNVAVTVPFPDNVIFINPNH